MWKYGYFLWNVPKNELGFSCSLVSPFIVYNLSVDPKWINFDLWQPGSQSPGRVSSNPCWLLASNYIWLWYTTFRPSRSARFGSGLTLNLISFRLEFHCPPAVAWERESGNINFNKSTSAFLKWRNFCPYFVPLRFVSFRYVFRLAYKTTFTVWKIIEAGKIKQKIFAKLFALSCVYLMY